jgi:hypothetical protein
MYRVSEEPAAVSSEWKTFTLNMGACSTMKMGEADSSETIRRHGPKDDKLNMYKVYRKIIFHFLC